MPRTSDCLLLLKSSREADLVSSLLKVTLIQYGSGATTINHIGILVWP